MVCRDSDLMWDAIILRENSSEIMNILGEVIAEIALRPDRYNQALITARAAGIKTLERLDRYVANQPCLDWVKPQAGLIGLARLDGIDGDVFAKRLLADPYRTFLLPGSSYGMQNHIRLGVGGGAIANLDLGLKRMGELLANW